VVVTNGQRIVIVGLTNLATFYRLLKPEARSASSLSRAKRSPSPRFLLPTDIREHKVTSIMPRGSFAKND
jgi:hypothetical protein